MKIHSTPGLDITWFPHTRCPLMQFLAYVPVSGGNSALVESFVQSYQRDFCVTLFFQGTKMRAMWEIGVFRL